MKRTAKNSDIVFKNEYDKRGPTGNYIALPQNEKGSEFLDKHFYIEMLYGGILEPKNVWWTMDYARRYNGPTIFRTI